MAESRWRRLSREVIARTLAGLPPDADEKTTRAALRAAYPFGVREHHPYRMWCAEVKRVLHGESPRGVGRRLAEAIASPGLYGRTTVELVCWLEPPGQTFQAAAALGLFDGYLRLAGDFLAARPQASAVKGLLYAERVMEGESEALRLNLRLGQPPMLRRGHEASAEAVELWCVEAWGVVMRYIEAQ